MPVLFPPGLAAVERIVRDQGKLAFTIELLGDIFFFIVNRRRHHANPIRPAGFRIWALIMRVLFLPFSTFATR